MKKIYLGLITVLISGCQMSQEYGYSNSSTGEIINTATYIDNYVLNQNSVPIYEKKTIMTTDAARNFSIDLPKRCSIDWNNQQILSVVPEQELSMIRLDTGDKLPNMEVKEFSFKNENLMKVMERLLENTNITVVSDSPISTTVSGEIQAGNITDAIELITRLGHFYYSYNEEHKLIKISANTKWLFKMPKDEMIVLALIDAMRGANLKNLLVNWEEKTIAFNGDYLTEKEMNNLISSLSNKKYIVAFDVDVYRLYPKTDNAVSWIDILPAFGNRNVKMSIPGTVGRLLVTSPEINTKTLQEFISTKANAVLISQGTFALPNKWQSKFEIGQCSREDRLETDLSLVATAKYGPYGNEGDKFETNLVLRTGKGEIASFEIPSNLGDNFVIVGIPTHTFVTSELTTISPYAELVMFISPKLISIQEVEQAKSLKGMSGDDLRDFLNIDLEVDSDIEEIKESDIEEKE